jgi:hypothetical protein
MTKEELKKELETEAKAKGLDLAEKSLEEIVDFLFSAVGKIVSYTPNQYDNMVWAAIKGTAEELIDGLVDKIDGKEG